MDFLDPSHREIRTLTDVATAQCGWFGVFFHLCGFFDGFVVGLFVVAAVLLAELLCPGTSLLLVWGVLVSAAPGHSAALPSHLHRH